MATHWHDLPFPWKPSPAALAETLTGGQAFRWKATATNTWQGIWSTHRVTLRQRPDGHVQWQGEPASEKALAHYLAARLDFEALGNALPWRSDPRIAHALKCWSGLRILHQPFAETLLAFLCSPTKRIPQIAAVLETLAERYGQPIGGKAKALPDWPAIHRAGEAGLRTTGMGYRARGIAATAAFLSENPDWLAETETLPYTEAKLRLITLPGVGEKIADCVLLFGAGRLEAFPVDTWVIKAMARLYQLDGWNAPQVAHFGRIHFGPAAGYAQQLLFTEERRR